MSIPVLVTDGEQRAALAVVRSLGRSGFAPHVASAFRKSIAGASRFARGRARTPDPLSDPAGFVDAIEDLVGRWEVRVLLPVTEASVLAVLAARDRFAHVALPLPSLETFRAISDKALLLETAASLGIAVPHQQVVESSEDSSSLLGAELGFPVVLKPARSVGEAGGERAKLGVRHAADRDQLRDELARLPPAAYPVLVQRRIEGPGVGVFLLRWAGEVLAVFAHRRLREKPPSGGVSVYCESIRPDAELVARSSELLERFDWQGVAMVEYKIETSTGTAYLMEVNGRFWGSLQLAVDAGVDFPTLLVRCALGEAPLPVTDFRVGLRNRWWWGDVDHLLARIRRSASDLSLEAGAPGRLQVVREFLKLWRPGEHSEVFRFSDLWPAVRETVDWFRRR